MENNDNKPGDEAQAQGNAPKVEGTRQCVLLVLDDHNVEEDLLGWGEEFIYRNGKRCGVTASNYGQPFEKHECLGFIENLDKNNVPQKITDEFVLSGHYEVLVCGLRYSAKVSLFSPELPIEKKN